MNKDIQILLIPDVHGRQFWKQPVMEVLENTNAKTKSIAISIYITFVI